MNNLYPGRWRCGECGHVSTLHGMLTAPNPFCDTDEVRGCAKCKACEPRWIELCDECDAPASCGTPTKTGYRRTCGKHAPSVYLLEVREYDRARAKVTLP